MLKKILFRAAGLLLALSAIGKIYLLHGKSAGTFGSFLGQEAIPLYWVLVGAVALELTLAAYACFSPSSKTAYQLVYLGLFFTTYRVTILVFDFKAPCSCLGDLPQLLGVGKGADHWLSWMVYLLYVGISMCLVLLPDRKDVTAATKRLA